MLLEYLHKFESYLKINTRIVLVSNEDLLPNKTYKSLEVLQNKGGNPSLTPHSAFFCALPVKGTVLDRLERPDTYKQT